MRGRRAAAVLLLCLLLAPAARAAPRLVLFSWDGAADWVVDRLLVEGRLPHVARLAETGAAAEYSLSSFPSKTAVAHAALWTGCWAPCNGVSGNRVPLHPAAENDVLASASGFASAALTAEPLWVTAALAGRRVAVLQATQTDPAAPFVERLRQAGVPADRLRLFNGFDHEVAPAAVVTETALRPARAADWRPAPRHRGSLRELELEVGETRLFGLVYDDPLDPVPGYDSLLVRSGGRGAVVGQTILKPRAAAPPGSPPQGWSAPLPARREDTAANTFLRLFVLAPDGGRLLLYQRTAAALAGSFSAEDLAGYLAACPGASDDPFWLYVDGALGTPLMANGDGAAEERLLELVAFDTRLLRDGTTWALATWRPDLLFHYSPMGDSAGHTWMGVLDPASPLHDAALAEKLWPFYAAVFAELDTWLGEAAAAAGPDALVALVSDHGMMGVARRLHVNRLLEEAGLLARVAGEEKGKIDLERTQVLMPPWGDFAVAVNDGRRRGGVVPAAGREAVIDRAAAALLAARDPETGAALVERVFRPEELPGLGIGGARGGDLYFDPASGVYPSSRLADAALAPPGRPWGSGEHGYYPERRAMHAIFYLAGAGVAAGVRLPPVRHIDVAPTLARLLGLPAPAQSAGRIVAEALASEAETIERKVP